MSTFEPTAGFTEFSIAAAEGDGAELIILISPAARLFALSSDFASIRVETSPIVFDWLILIDKDAISIRTPPFLYSISALSHESHIMSIKKNKKE